MGTDIHILVERKKSGKWTYDPYEVEYFRNYVVFNILAGAHGGQWKISKPRGCPVDMDMPQTTMNLYCPSHYLEEILECQIQHNVSWLLLSEILDWFDVSPEKWGRKKRLREERIKEIEGLEWFVEMMQNIATDLNEEPENIRLIFGFDS